MAVTFSESDMFVKKSSERQISVDPISVRNSSSMRIDSFNMMMPPAMSPPRDFAVPLPMPLYPASSKYMRFSPPNSNGSSPRFASTSTKQIKSKYGSPKKHSQASSLSLPSFGRSKSFAEGRACAPSVDLDQWSSKEVSAHSSFSSKKSSSKNESNKTKNTEETFTCCLYLPSLGKGKPLRSPKKEAKPTPPPTPKTTTPPKTPRPTQPPTTIKTPTAIKTPTTTTIKPCTDYEISKRFSLEKFECRFSDSSSTKMPEHKKDSVSRYSYDLPVEVAKDDEEDTFTPVSAAFVFDNHVKRDTKKASSFKGKTTSEAPLCLNSTRVPYVC